VQRLLHLSALGADPAGPSRYLRTKGEGEALVADAGLATTIFRPSVIFGREDRLTNLFAKLSRLLPVLMLGGARARFQPVYVGDVAYCVVHALGDDTTIGQRYNLCGPKVYTLRELVRFAGEASGHPRPIIGLGGAAARLQALALEILPGGLMSRDNLLSMSRDNVCDGPFPAVFGLEPTALEAVAPSWLGAAAVTSQYDVFREHSGR
jgi:NADH dehydrogenase